MRRGRRVRDLAIPRSTWETCKGRGAASPARRCSAPPSSVGRGRVPRAHGERRRSDVTRCAPGGSPQPPSHGELHEPTACVDARCRTPTPTHQPLGTSLGSEGPRSRAVRRPPTTFWVRQCLQQLVRPPRHRELSLEFTDPLPSRRQLGRLGRRGAGANPSVDLVLVPPVVDRLRSDPSSAAISATGLPASIRSSTLRRNSAGYLLGTMTSSSVPAIQRSRSRDLWGRPPWQTRQLA